MDLDKLNSIDTTNAAQVKQLQQFLKSRGYYTGPIDGKWGGGTTTATVRLRDELVEARKDLRATKEAEARGKEAENDPTARVTKLATEVGPYAVGALAGYGLSRGMKRGFDAKDQTQRADVKRLATNTAINPAVAEQELNRLNRGRHVRTASQFLVPGALMGAGEATRRYIAPQFGDEKTREAINLVATGEQAAGTTLAAKQLFDLATRGSPNDPVDVATIRTRAIPPDVPPGGTPPANPPAALKPNSQRLIAAARAAGATGKLTKTTAAAYLATNVTDANRAAVAKELGVGPGQKIASAVKRLASKAGSSSILLPLAAGAYAAGEAGSEARAEGAGAGETAARSGVAGAAAGGLVAGGVAGMNKLAEVGARYAPTAMRVAGRVAGPVGMGLAAHDVVQGINRLAHLSPPQDPREYSTMGAFMPPEGGNAMAQAGAEPDPFGAALDEFLRLAPEMQMQGGP